MPTIAELVQETGSKFTGYSYAFLDSAAKRELRRAMLKAVAIPGYQVPFGSREVPVARGFGTGGLQITLSIIGPGDVVKVIDQGDDAGVNANNIRRLIERTTGLPTTLETAEATVVQTRHRIPEEVMREDQILVLQVPYPEPLRLVERSQTVARTMHGEKDYAQMWLALYEDVVRKGEVTIGAGYPVVVNHRYIMAPTPVPRWDLPKLHRSRTLHIFGAGREKRIYAIPPYTDVCPMEFDDIKFKIEEFGGQPCARCGSTAAFLTERLNADGSRTLTCSDTAYCDLALTGGQVETWY